MVQTKPSSEPGQATPAYLERRLEILKRAAEVFRAKGFHAAGMREIAEGLGVAPGALYYYFPSKNDLLHACQTIALDRLIQGARAIAREEAPAAARLRRLVRHHLDVVLDVLGGSAAHLEFAALPAEHRRAIGRRRDAYEGIVRRVIRDGVRDGTLRSVDEKTAALALLGALNWTVVWWRPQGRRTAEELGSTYADLFLHGLEAGAGEAGARREP